MAFEELYAKFELICTRCANRVLLLRLPYVLIVLQLLLIHDLKEVFVRVFLLALLELLLGAFILAQTKFDVLHHRLYVFTHLFASLN